MELTNNRIVFEDILSSRGRVKILKLLALNNEMNISNIVKKAGLNHRSVKNHLIFLKHIDFIQEKQFGRIRIYRYKLENLKARALKNLIVYWEDFDNSATNYWNRYSMPIFFQFYSSRHKIPKNLKFSNIIGIMRENCIYCYFPGWKLWPKFTWKHNDFSSFNYCLDKKKDGWRRYQNSSSVFVLCQSQFTNFFSRWRNPPSKW